jgi:hypothetical protein
MHTKQQNFVKEDIKKTKKAVSWEHIVDAEINKIGLGIVSSNSGCSLL